MQMTSAQKIQDQYHLWPYPNIPLIGSVRQTDTWQINLNYLADRCGVKAPPRRPKILIVGCGTFQPYVFALANPNADILATDFSETSLKIAQRRNNLHGIRNVCYQQLDLNQAIYPEGPFDYIECYGVLMSMTDPEAVMNKLAERLTAHGILRVMVYPAFGRKAIFQIQRLAKLLRLHYEDRAHPRLLRKIMLSLPHSHPLYHTFTTYRDTENAAGIVDAFLHPCDRAFTGHQFGTLIAGARLKPAFYFHRPWGQPEVMAKRLNIAEHSQSFMLHYLDLWQEIRTNFIVCLTRKESPFVEEDAPLLHPLLTGEMGSLFHRLSIYSHRLFGITLTSRTEAGSIHLSGNELRLLSRKAGVDANPALIEKAIKWGMMLSGKSKPCTMPAHGVWAREEQFLESPIEIGARSANPFYEAIFKAYTFQRDCAPEGLAVLPDQVAQWLQVTDPMEDQSEFGLTPLGTYVHFSKEILSYLQERNKERVDSFEGVRFEEEKRSDVSSFLKSFSGLPKVKWTEGQMRELWVLLFSYRHLFLNSKRL
ncbi:MAG: methyltransferase domain-containing protein [Nitrospirota bacterium]